MADHGDYKMGSMDISDHQKTWGAFTKLVTYSSLATLVIVFILIFIFG